ncbi:MAG: P-loop NTPase [Thermodesulfobacteriota bacterium]|nr:P-loop NTPase [Thermodesulfobacteriota bacterium]
MKIAICGKGGSGKSTITALLATKLAQQNINVLVIDADESNTGLHRLLGVKAPVNLLDHIGGKKAFKQKLNQQFPRADQELFGQSLPVSSLSSDYTAAKDGVQLVAVGKIQDAGEGCACPMGVLSKMVLSKLVTGPNDVVLIDTEAGIEHFGRGLDENCDMIIGVVDPSYESFLLAERITGMVQHTGAELHFILNKADSRSETAMRKHVADETIAAVVVNDDILFSASLEGTPLETDMPAINPVCEMIINRLSRRQTQ